MRLRLFRLRLLWCGEAAGFSEGGPSGRGFLLEGKPTGGVAVPGIAVVRGVPFGFDVQAEGGGCVGAHVRLLSGALDVEDVLVPKGDFLTMVQVLGEEEGDVSEVAVESVSVAAGDAYPHPFGLVGVDESDADGVAGIGGVADLAGGDLEGIWVLALGCDGVQEFDRGSCCGLVSGFHGFCSFSLRGR